MGFQKDFIWGAASASAQIEGAWDEDGRTPSVWDVLPHGSVRRDETPHDACDHYHRWREDVAVMKEIGLKAYRFSISWSRVIPRRGEVNPKGLQFYCDLVDALIEEGIEPMVTLFHSDLPIWVAENGGWENEETVDDFTEYVRLIVSALADKVHFWFTFNEPQCFTSDVTAHGDVRLMTRTVLLSHGKAVQIIREGSTRPPKIGLVVMGICAIPVEGYLTPQAAAETTFSDAAASLGMSWWMDPAVLGKVPEPLRDTLSEEDIKTICQPLDFYAVNTYYPANYSEAPGRPNPLMRPGMPRLQNGEAFDSAVMYWTAKFCYERYGLPILFTENGFSQPDFVCLDGKVHDPQRADFIHRYLLDLKKAVDEGIPVLGYIYWSLLDNFEWISGYDVRFGLVHVDYNTMKRTIKDSARFYSQVIASNGDIL